MKPSLADLHDRALKATRNIVHEIANEEYDWPTPCGDWTVRELLNHVVSGNLWASELMAGKTIEEVGGRFDGDLLGFDPLAVYEESAKVADHAFQQSGAMERMAAVSYGPVSGEVYCGHRFVDVLIHGWDLAKATGQNTIIDPSLVDAAIAVMEPQLEMLRASGAFATDVEVADDADPQTQLLAWSGRKP
ncbi:MAG: TIGR03086 family protein [Actinobacteria bacterium]|nr:TIGR03086 family protein [Actinomycetota bacterium]